MKTQTCKCKQVVPEHITSCPFCGQALPYVPPPPPLPRAETTSYGPIVSAPFERSSTHRASLGSGARAHFHDKSLGK